MPVQHVNRCGDTYDLHQGLTKTGKPKYHFSKKDEGELCDTIPVGFEVYENPRGQVFCRRERPRHIAPLEVEVVKQWLVANEKDDFTLVDVKDKDIIIWESNAREIARTVMLIAGIDSLNAASLKASLQTSSTYQESLKFSLVDVEERLFAPSRWCWRGSIDDWKELIEVPMPLPDLMGIYGPHLGEESFFELM